MCEVQHVRTRENARRLTSGSGVVMYNIHCTFFQRQFLGLRFTNMEKLAIHNEKNLAIKTQPMVCC